MYPGGVCVTLVGMPGIFILEGMGMQIPPGGLKVSIAEDGSASTGPVTMLVRLDLWTTWLEIGCRSAGDAAAAAREMTPDMPDAHKGVALTAELHAGLVAMTSLAFAIDGFYDTIRHEMGHHPDEAAWRRNRLARHSQVVETLRFLLKLGPNFTGQLGILIKELFEFRGRAVHPSSAFVEPNYRPDVDSGVHPHLLTYSGPHAVQARALVLTLLGRLLERAAEISKEGDPGWLDRGRAELIRLSQTFRTPGDDEPAFVTHPVE
jgi:hypothetical protein